MGSKIKTVQTGGGQATGVANDFNNWLRQGLQNGQYGTVGQTQGIGATIDSLLGGRQGGFSGQDTFNSILSRASGMPSYQVPQISNPLNGVGAIGSGLNPNTLTQGMGSRPNVPGIGQLNLPGQAPTSLSYSLPGGGVDLSSILSQVGQRALLGGVDTSQANNAAQGLLNRNVDTSGAGNTSEFGAIQSILGNQFNRDIADIRERYGVSSAGLTNENLYRSQALPQLAQALSQSALGQRQAGQTDVGLGLQANQAGLQGLLSSLGIGLEGRGQDLQNQLGNRGIDTSALSLASNQSLQGIANMLTQRQQDLSGLGLGLEQRGQDLQALLAGRGQDLQQRDQDINAILQGRGLDINQLSLLSQNQLGNRGYDISSILGQGQLGLDTSRANQSASLQGQDLLQNYLLNLGNLGLGGAQLGLNASNSDFANRLGALQSLLGLYSQANQLGTPQAQVQTYQQPSGFSQALGAISGLAGGLGSLAAGGGLGGILGGLGGLFGGGSGGGSIPNLSTLSSPLPGVSLTPSYNPTMLPVPNLPRL